MVACGTRFLHLPHDEKPKVGCKQDIELLGDDSAACCLDDRQRMRWRCQWIERRRQWHAGTDTTGAVALGDADERQLPCGGHGLKQLSNYYIAECRDRQCHDFERERDRCGL